MIFYHQKNHKATIFMEVSLWQPSVVVLPPSGLLGGETLRHLCLSWRITNIAGYVIEETLKLWYLFFVWLQYQESPQILVHKRKNVKSNNRNDRENYFIKIGNGASREGGTLWINTASLRLGGFEFHASQIDLITKYLHTERKVLLKPIPVSILYYLCALRRLTVPHQQLTFENKKWNPAQEPAAVLEDENGSWHILKDGGPVRCSL